MRMLKVSLLLVVVLLVGVSAASADEGTATTIGEQLFILDGRVNSWDVAAPVAVYCQYDSDGLTGIELLGINDSNNGELALFADAIDIAAVGDSLALDTLVETDNGFSLYRARSGEFFVTAPADEEGKVYSFVWDEGDPGC